MRVEHIRLALLTRVLVRGMQSRTLLQELLAGVTSARDQVTASSTHAHRPKLLVKIAPDLSESEVADVAAAVRATDGIDGVIVSNTTIQRPSNLLDRTSMYICVGRI